MKHYQSSLLLSLFSLLTYAAQAPTPIIRVRARAVSEPAEKPNLNKKSSSNDSHITPPHASGSHSPQAPVVVGGSAHGSGSRSPNAPLSSGTPTHQSEKRSPIDPFIKTHEGNYDFVTRAPHIEINEGGAAQAAQRRGLFSSSRTAPAAQEDPAQQPSASASLRTTPKQQLRTIQPTVQPQPRSPATTVGLLAAAAVANIEQRHHEQYGHALHAAAPQPTPAPVATMQVQPLPFVENISDRDVKQAIEKLSPPSGATTTQASPVHASMLTTTMPPSLNPTPSPGNTYRAPFTPLATAIQDPINQDSTPTKVPTDVIAPPGFTSRRPRAQQAWASGKAAPQPESGCCSSCTIL